MKADTVFKFLPPFCSYFSKLPTRTCEKQPGRYVKSFFFQQIKKFSVAVDTSNHIFFKNLDVIEEKYVRSVKENKAFDLNLNDEFKKGINFQEVQRLLDEISVVRENIIALHELNSGNTKDMESAVKKEMKEYEDQIYQLKSQLLEVLTPADEEDSFKDLILEVNAGVGGQEAMLFGSEIFQMYSSYAVYKGWECDVIEMSSSELGGIRRACLRLSGADSCRLMKFEGGVHRVQRVPKTEKSGRIHTSTISVAVLPQPSEAKIILLDKDLKIETKRASGAGGQHVQTTDSAVRIVHLPTGIAAECQSERFQHKNKNIALQKLRALIYQKQKDELESKISSSRKIQVGSKGRSEKIRTYNYQQDRVTDHRIGKSMHDLGSFLGGGPPLDDMILLIYDKYKTEQLGAVFGSILSK